jgi:hypothetical protein
LNKGTIAGPSVTLGGNDNSDGVLTVKNASGNVIGTWNNEGVNISSGDIYIPFHFYVPYTNYDGYTKINGEEGLVCSVTSVYGTTEASFTYGELNINGIVPYNDNITHIYLANREQPFCVDESYDEIKKKLQNVVWII